MTRSSPRPSAGDQERLVAGIEQARKDLGDSVQALAARVDVPARMKDTAGRAREQFGTLSRTALPYVRQAAVRSIGAAGEALEKASQRLPEPSRTTAVRTTRQATGAAGRRPLTVVAVAGACVAAGLLRARRKRRS
jgi:hypothetical protein